MGVRVRKTVKLAPGVRATVSKSGVSYSAGTKYARVTKTARGQVLGTAKIPGSGISYVQNLGARHTPHRHAAAVVTSSSPAAHQPAKRIAPEAAPRWAPASDPAAEKTVPIHIPQQHRTGSPAEPTVKKRNPVGAWLGLPLITFGIYTYVWYYKIHREMAELDRRRGAPIAGPVLVLLLLGWTGIATLITFFNTGARIASAQRAAGLRPSCNPWIGLLLCFAFGLSVLYYQVELNKIADAHGPGDAGRSPVRQLMVPSTPTENRETKRERPSSRDEVHDAVTSNPAPHARPSIEAPNKDLHFSQVALILYRNAEGRCETWGSVLYCFACGRPTEETDAILSFREQEFDPSTTGPLFSVSGCGSACPGCLQLMVREDWDGLAVLAAANAPEDRSGRPAVARTREAIRALTTRIAYVGTR